MYILRKHLRTVREQFDLPVVSTLMFLQITPTHLRELPAFAPVNNASIIESPALVSTLLLHRQAQIWFNSVLNVNQSEHICRCL